MMMCTNNTTVHILLVCLFPVTASVFFFNSASAAYAFISERRQCSLKSAEFKGKQIPPIFTDKPEIKERSRRDLPVFNYQHSP